MRHDEWETTMIVDDAVRCPQCGDPDPIFVTKGSNAGVCLRCAQQRGNDWEGVHTSRTGHYDATDVSISVRRFPVPGGWIYKVTEVENNLKHRSVSICFVPKVTVHE
jgi:hypothetical protein